jgi:hypothetical protein
LTHDQLLFSWLQATRFINASAAGPAESRINLLHGTPRRRCGMGEARDWPHQSPIERIS